MDNVHVGIQRRRQPVELVRADAAEARWDLDIDIVDRNGEIDFRGPDVQGKPGERFLYLTWGDVGDDGGFEMFRRAKLMLHRVDAETIDAARNTGILVAHFDLTGGDDGPVCARVGPPAISWSTALMRLARSVMMRSESSTRTDVIERGG